MGLIKVELSQKYGLMQRNARETNFIRCLYKTAWVLHWIIMIYILPLNNEDIFFCISHNSCENTKTNNNQTVSQYFSSLFNQPQANWFPLKTSIYKNSPKIYGSIIKKWSVFP